MKKFFWWCAGAHKPILERYPQESNKYVSIGATVFFTALFAAMAGGYAMYFVFSGSAWAFLPALLFGAIWGLAIFNLDRYIVLTLDKSRGPAMQFLQAVPRLILAVIIGIVISRPLELRIFDKEIREFLKREYLQQQNARIDTLNKAFENKYLLEHARLTRMKTEADSLESDIKTTRQQLNHEIFGTKTEETSGVLGYGPYARMKSDQLQRQEIYLDSLRSRVQLSEQMLQDRKAREGLLDGKMLSHSSLDSAVQVAGFSDRNMALSNLHIRADGTADPSVEHAVFFIALLFVFFECLPVLVKLMSARDPYDTGIKATREVQDYDTQDGTAMEKSAIDQLREVRLDAARRRRTAEIELPSH